MCASGGAGDEGFFGGDGSDALLGGPGNSVLVGEAAATTGSFRTESLACQDHGQTAILAVG